MSNIHNARSSEGAPAMPGRRKVLVAGLGLAAASMVAGVAGCAPIQATATQTQRGTGANSSQHSSLQGRRRLGTLEVSSVGLGVQNMSRTYQTTIPTRSEMFNIIRAAFDRGVTFFDAAEAYGPHEVERILGEGVAPFRDEVDLLHRWAERKEATPAQISLAWLMAQKPWIVPIPGTTQMAHMLENIGADAVQFTAAELSELNQSVAAIEVQGAWLPDGILALSGVEAPPKP